MICQSGDAPNQDRFRESHLAKWSVSICRVKLDVRSRKHWADHSQKSPYWLGLIG